MVLQISAEMTEMDKKAFKEAKEMVWRLEQSSNGDPNKMRAAITKAQPEIPTGTGYASADTVYKMRVTEMARAYIDVSDGKMGIDPQASKVATNSLQNILDGKHPSGQGHSLANRTAITANKPELLSSGIAEGFKGMFGARNVAAGLAITFAVGAASAAEPNATPTSVRNAMIDSNPIAREVRGGSLCGAFGQAVGTAAAVGAGAVTGIAINGAAAGATALTGGAAAPVTIPVMIASAGAVVAVAGATHQATAPLATSACSFIANKFGM